MSRVLLVSLTLLSSLFFSSSASACDDKACESAYLAATKQYVSNYARHAKAFEVERRAHSLNRERRAYALYVHQHFMKNKTGLSKKI